MGNYIKINRKILDWEWWDDINTQRLFLYMLLKANWKDGKYKGLYVPRGSLTSTVRKLSEDTCLTIDEVRTALKHLKSTNEIKSKSYGKFTLFTIQNYNTYQDKESEMECLENIVPVHEEKEEVDGKYEIIKVETKTVKNSEIKFIMEKWNELQNVGIKSISRLNNGSKRYDSLVARIKEYGYENVLTAIENIKLSEYCQGRNKYGWQITFDWFVKPNNFYKVLDGNYDNRNGGDINGTGREIKKYDDRIGESK